MNSAPEPPSSPAGSPAGPPVPASPVRPAAVAPASGTAAAVADPGERERKFLEQSYWRLGSVMLAWSTVTMVCVLRRRALDIPIFGTVQPVEAIIFTGSAFCFLLPLLLVIVAMFRHAAVRHDWRTRVPGVLADVANVPAAFDWLRVAVFFTLVILPAATLFFCYRRTVDNLQIYAISAPTPGIILQGEQIFGWPPREANGKAHDWRWRGESIKLSKDEEEARLTAIVPWQPWAFRTVAYGGAGAALWFLLLPPGVLRAQWERVRIRRASEKKLESPDA